MFSTNTKLNSSGPGSKDVLASLKDLSASQVFVGIPEARAPRKKGQITNAALAFIHTHGARQADMRRVMGAMRINKGLNYSQALALYIHTRGSPLWQIPPRPIIEPAIEDKTNRDLIDKELQAAAKAALGGNKSLMMTHMRRAGLTAQNAVKAWFTNPKNHWAPNAPSTIKRKGSSRPLVDTGALRQSITYVVESG